MLSGKAFAGLRIGFVVSAVAAGAAVMFVRCR